MSYTCTHSRLLHKPKVDELSVLQDFLGKQRNRFTAAGADWQLHAYGNTLHSFTNPQANDRANGMVYDEAADRRSWHAVLQFLDEVLR